MAPSLLFLVSFFLDRGGQCRSCKQGVCVSFTRLLGFKKSTSPRAEEAAAPPITTMQQPLGFVAQPPPLLVQPSFQIPTSVSMAPLGAVPRGGIFMPVGLMQPLIMSPTQIATAPPQTQQQQFETQALRFFEYVQNIQDEAVNRGENPARMRRYRLNTQLEEVSPKKAGSRVRTYTGMAKDDSYRGSIFDIWGNDAAGSVQNNPDNHPAPVPATVPQVSPRGSLPPSVIQQTQPSVVSIPAPLGLVGGIQQSAALWMSVGGPAPQIGPTVVHRPSIAGYPTISTLPTGAAPLSGRRATTQATVQASPRVSPR